MLAKKSALRGERGRRRGVEKENLRKRIREMGKGVKGKGVLSTRRVAEAKTVAELYLIYLKEQLETLI